MPTATSVWSEEEEELVEELVVFKALDDDDPDARPVAAVDKAVPLSGTTEADPAAVSTDAVPLSPTEEDPTAGATELAMELPAGATEVEFVDDGAEVSEGDGGVELAVLVDD